MDSKDLELNEATFKEIIAKNKCLSEELQLCIKDKDFVWNLWKEMQVSNPNTANLINSVIEREQEKSDIKAAKVLTVLQEKDQQINILQEISADLQIQWQHTNERISELLVKESDWQKKEEELNTELDRLQTEISNKDELRIAKDELVREIEHNAKQQITELETKIEEASVENASLKELLNSLNENLKNISKQKNDLEGNVVSKNENLVSIDAKLDDLHKEKERLISENEIHKANTKKLKANLKNKTKEVAEVQEYWENEVKRNIEKMNKQSGKIELLQQELLSSQKELKEHTNCKQLMEEQANLVEKLERLQEESQTVLNQQQATYEAETNNSKKTIKKLRKKVQELQKDAKMISENKENAPVPPHDVDKSNIPVNSSFKMVEKYTQTSANHEDSSLDSERESKQIEMLSNLIKSMEVELQTTRTAHKQRLHRYKLLEENANLLQQQLATYEDESDKKEKKIIRASSKSLQQEGSMSVWNELEYYRQQYEKLSLETPKLKEEIDELMVERSHNDTLINQLRVEVDEIVCLVHEKDREIENKEIAILEDASRIKYLQEEIQSYRQKFSVMEKGFYELEDTCNSHIKKEQALLEKITNLTTEVKSLKNHSSSETEDQETQTDLKGDEFKKFIHRNVVDTIPQKESYSNVSHISLVSVATQTSTRSKRLESASQTDETNDSVQQSELEKLQIAEEKDNLTCQYKQLQVLKNKLLQENEKLRARQSSLKNEMAKVIHSEKSIHEYVNNLENCNEKLKSELLENLQTLKETTELLEEKSKAVQEYSQELNAAASNEEKGKNMYKKKIKEVKSVEKQLEEVTAKCSQLSFQVKALAGENEMLTDKQKMFQSRVAKLEKDLIQKKTLYAELKLKCDELKNDASQSGHVTDNLKLKLEAITEREKNKKVYIEELKSKMDSLVKEKCTMQDTISALKEENRNKTELLHKTERLCHQAEIAINEIELSNINQIENEKKSSEVKNTKMSACYQKCIKQVTEFKSVVRKFSEAILLKICENQRKMLEMKKQKKKKEIEAKQNSLFSNSSSNIACSILGMSTQDLVEFMNEDTIVDDESFRYDFDMKNKLDLILKKETHFEKVLTQFLLELVKYNDNLHDQKVGIN